MKGVEVRACEAVLDGRARELAGRLERRGVGAFRLDLTARVVTVLGVPVLAAADPASGAARLGVPLDEGEQASAAPVDDRFEKLALHEIGHLMGLEHCGTRGCVMRRVERARDLDSLSTDRCGVCG